jgi:hypothetical protein
MQSYTKSKNEKINKSFENEVTYIIDKNKFKRHN